MPKDGDSDPIALMRDWLAEAERSEPVNPGAAALATAGADGAPSVRMVLLKGLDERGMVCDFGDIKRVVKRWVDAELDRFAFSKHVAPQLSEQRLARPAVHQILPAVAVAVASLSEHRQSHR